MMEVLRKLAQLYDPWNQNELQAKRHEQLAVRGGMGMERGDFARDPWIWLEKHLNIHFTAVDSTLLILLNPSTF